MENFEDSTNLQPTTFLSLIQEKSASEEISYETKQAIASQFVAMPLSKSFGEKCIESLAKGKYLSRIKEGKEFHFIIKLLAPAKTPANVEDSLALQQAITDNLSGEQKGFITQKSASVFMALTDMHHGITVGIFDSETHKLIGQSSVSFTNLKDVKCDVFKGTKPTAYNPDSLDCTPVTKIFEVKGTMVHPDYNGMKLSTDLAIHIEDIVKAMYSSIKTMLMAEVATSNATNLHVCQKSGFKALQKYVASDNVECYLLYKPMDKKLMVATGFSDSIHRAPSSIQMTSRTAGMQNTSSY